MSELPAAPPAYNREAEPFWSAAAKGRLVLPVCDACDHPIWYPRSWCPLCGSDSVTWTEMSGKGTVHTFSVVYQNRAPGFAEELPYAVGYITLDEGPQIMSNITGIDPAELKIGQKVEVYYEDATPELTVPKFRPIK